MTPEHAVGIIMWSVVAMGIALILGMFAFWMFILVAAFFGLWERTDD